MRDDKLLLTVAIIAVTVSLVAAGFTYFSVVNLATKISGFASSTTGVANLTVASVASINFSIDSIEWGAGTVTAGLTRSGLNTYGSVTGGNWTARSSGLVIENNGNVNITLNLSTGKTNDTFIGGSSPSYKWNITQNETNSCLNASGIFGLVGGGTSNLNLGQFYNVNTTSTIFCNVMMFADSSDQVRIDINLSIPQDSKTGLLTDTITAGAVAV